MKYGVKVIFSDGREIDENEVFDTYEEAYEYGLQISSTDSLGGEIFSMSNPGDYPFEETDSEIEVYEIYY